MIIYCMKIHIHTKITNISVYTHTHTYSHFSPFVSRNSFPHQQKNRNKSSFFLMLFAKFCCSNIVVNNNKPQWANNNNNCNYHCGNTDCAFCHCFAVQRLNEANECNITYTLMYICILIYMYQCIVIYAWRSGMLYISDMACPLLLWAAI